MLFWSSAQKLTLADPSMFFFYLNFHCLQQRHSERYMFWPHYETVQEDIQTGRHHRIGFSVLYWSTLREWLYTCIIYFDCEVHSDCSALETHMNFSHRMRKRMARNLFKEPNATLCFHSRKRSFTFCHGSVLNRNMKRHGIRNEWFVSLVLSEF